MQKTILLIAIIAIHISSINIYAGTYSGGAGTLGDPYQIATTADLIELSNTPTDWGLIRFIQTADIVFDANPQNVDWDGDGTATWDSEDQLGFSPIGNSILRFYSYYEGNTYSISNLYINRPSSDYIGLFGYFGNIHQVKRITNLGLINVNIIGRDNVGGLCGYGYYQGEINNCYTSGNVVGSNNVGGLIGQMFAYSTNNYSSASVTGVNAVGGLIGEAVYKISNSFSNGNVIGLENSDKVGGLVGEAIGEINYCYSTGDVSSSGNNVGGFLGMISSENELITNCYSSGKVTRTAGTGAAYGCFVGAVSEDLQINVYIKNCYSTGSLFLSDSGDQTFKAFFGSGHISLNQDGDCFQNCFVEVNDGDVFLPVIDWYSEDGVGPLPSNKTAAEMKTQATFTGWDFGTDSTDWVMSSPIAFDGYPTFRWTGGYSVAPNAGNIDSLPNLVWVAENSSRWASTYTQTADINMWTVPSWDGNKGWTPIGNSGNVFDGSYDGNNFKISNLYINRPDTDYIGLFGYPDYSTISNLGLINVNIIGKDNVGGLVGYNANDVSVSTCYCTGSVSGGAKVGGLIGANNA